MRGVGMRLGLIALALTTLVQCGEEDSVASKVDFTIAPKKPVVINADLTLFAGTDNERVIAKPWIKYGPKIVNNSDKTITIIAMNFKISAITDSGYTEEEKGLDVGLYGGTIIDELAPGETYEPGSIFYLDALPSGAVGFVYTIQAEITGWVGDATGNNATARLNKTFTFTTN